MPIFPVMVCTTVELFLTALSFLILARAILGIFITEEDGVGLYNFCYAVTEPVVSPVRAALFKVETLASLGIDLSFFATYLLILLIRLCLPVL